MFFFLSTCSEPRYSRPVQGGSIPGEQQAYTVYHPSRLIFVSRERYLTQLATLSIDPQEQPGELMADALLPCTTAVRGIFFQSNVCNVSKKSASP